jgi:hypothetical protein
MEIIMAHAPAVPLITTIAAHSPLAKFKWDVAGMAPIGYVKGMAVAFARAYCKLKLGVAAAIDMARPDIGDDERDALTHYRFSFIEHGMDNSHGGADVLRHLFVLMYGLGLRESSGEYNVGKDFGNHNPAASSAEAGLFQVSFDSHRSTLLMDKLFMEYRGSTDFLDIFKEGINHGAKDPKNYGNGAIAEFQKLTKECPAFAVEYAALALRHVRQYSGPINRKKVQIVRECDEMFHSVQWLIDRGGYRMV